MTEPRRWGKAGQRLTAEQARQRDTEAARRRLARAAEERRLDLEHRRDLEVARRMWAEGLVIPAHITIALDDQGLYGPEVDEACLAKEPDVDLWELGKLYPSWEQICALADLTRKQPKFFMAPVRQLISAYETSMRFHLRRGESIPLPVVRFTARALANSAKLGVRV